MHRGTGQLAPTRLIAKGHPDRDAICAAIRDQVAALPAGSVVLAEDETHLDLLARIRACWMLKGQRHRVLTPGSNVRRTIHGAVNLPTGGVHHHISVKKVSVVFCYFPDRLLTAYPDAPVVAVIRGDRHLIPCGRNGTERHTLRTKGLVNEALHGRFGR